MIICLEGIGRYRICRGSAPTEVVLKSGQALAIVPQSDLAVRPVEPYRSLFIAVGDGHVRMHIAVNRRRYEGAGFPRLDHEARLLLTDVPAVLHHAMMALVARAASAPAQDMQSRRLLAVVLAVVHEALAQPPDRHDGRAIRRLHAATAFVREHLGESIGRADVALAIGVDPAHVSRLFRRHTGDTFNAWLWRQRLEAASVMLADPRRSIADVAAACGCPDANYFARRFRQAFGVQPRLWTQPGVYSIPPDPAPTPASRRSPPH